MGKKLFQEVYASQTRTKELDLPEMVVVTEADDRDTVDFTYHSVHRSYFSNDKAVCPYCQGTNTAETKIRPRKFKDVLYDKGKRKTIDLIFHQRYFRCNDCEKRIFHENIDFAEEGCRYTNRLSDLLAEGTLTRTYEKVCKEYGVPASKASVGVIMRRRLRMRLEEMPPMMTPDRFIIFVSYYYSEAYPVVLGLYDKELRLVDILNGSNIPAYTVFFSKFDRDVVKAVYIDPDEQLHMAVSATFPEAKIMVSDECIQRYARDAFQEVIRKDGSRCSIPHRHHLLTMAESYLSPFNHDRVTNGLRNRSRLRGTYNAYQDLLKQMESEWDINCISEWLDHLPMYLSNEAEEDEELEELWEFEILRDVMDIYNEQIQAYLKDDFKLPASVASSVKGIIDALNIMPYCIYDVLHARMLLNVEHDKRVKDGKSYQIGVQIDKLTEKMNKISSQIRKKKENEEYGYEPENQ